MEATYRKLPIVILSMSRWDGDFSSASWSLAKAFARENEVYYVDYPFTWMDVVREWGKDQVKKRRAALIYGIGATNPIPGQGDRLRSLTPKAMLPINWAPSGSGMYAALSRWNNRSLFRTIHRELRKAGHSSYILFNSFNPLYGYERPKGMEVACYAYQSRDNLRALEYYLKKHGERLETEVIRNADFSLATSKQLRADLMELSGREVHYFPNAADIELFSQAQSGDIPRPADIAHIDKTMIGYTGNICQRMDYEILLDLSNRHPDKAIVLVGPKNYAAHTDIPLDKLPNVHFCGPKKIEELPGYLAHFDVLILPFKCNELTRSIYPLKINEYLASGKPVVSTNFSEDIAGFGDTIYLSNTAGEFSGLIDKALQSENDEKRARRISVSKTNSWDARVKLFWEISQGVLDRR